MTVLHLRVILEVGSGTYIRFVILNLFQDNMLRWLVILKQVQDDVAICNTAPEATNKKAAQSCEWAAFCMCVAKALCFVACLG